MGFELEWCAEPTGNQLKARSHGYTEGSHAYCTLTLIA